MNAETCKAAFPSAPAQRPWLTPLPDSRPHRHTPNNYSLLAHLQVWTEQGPPDATDDNLGAPTRELTGLVPVTPLLGTRRSRVVELVRDWELAFQVDRVNASSVSGESGRAEARGLRAP